MDKSRQQTAVDWFADNIDDLISDELRERVELLKNEAKQMEMEQRKDDITDYNIKVTEFLLNPLFNLEHSKHGIACEKLADIRNEFIKKL